MARPRTFDEHEVVAAARRQFNETGFHGTSVGELSRATGLSKGSLYGAFGDKDGLFQRAFDDYCAGTDEGAAARLEGPEGEALDRAREWLRTTARSSDTSGCLLARGTAELASENPAVAARADAAYATLLAGCRGLVEQAQRAGQVDAGADAAALGGLILATQRGLEALGRAGVDPSVRVAIADAAIDGITAVRAPS
ncbi:TetR/AcrR family transcriptional regulator [Patulibacter sp.]|uniref:TetR/AcrR family transcriptional regulator n=1 Tax=Patulibacter sp. TaxID=1912859 RepID=UPI002717E07E|nr:TetR/AcrR family transcriptional regulator [Patulibacter sp.]MDO9407955.1 helix-turn-helix domain-containing protein [Patulibacter sp.]